MPMIVVSKNIRYMRIFAGFLGEGTSNTIHVTVYLRPNSMQPVVDVYSTCCELVTCGCDGQRLRSRDGPILSVSSIISIIVAFTGRVL